MGRRLIRSPANNTLPRPIHSPLSTSTLTVDDPILFDSTDDRETHNYKALLDAFIVLLQRDRDLLTYVFPQDLQSLVFTKLIELPLVYMREEALHLCESIERLTHKLDAGKFATYGLFSILKWFLKSRPTFAKLYQVDWRIHFQRQMGEKTNSFICRKVMLLVVSSSQLFPQHSNNLYATGISLV